jgi:hypothetical protein
MIIGYAKVSTTEQNLALQRDALQPAFDASVDPTAFCFPLFHGPGRFRGWGKGSSSGTSDRYVR